MSRKAMEWAERQRLPTSGAQFVLFELAWWSDPEGIVRYVNVAHLGEVTRQSRASIMRHLAQFETFGLFVRSRTIGADGEVVHGGRFDFERTVKLPLRTRTKGVDGGESDGEDATEGGEESHIETPVAYRDSEDGVAYRDKPVSHIETRTYIPESLKEILPPTSPMSEAAEKEAAREERFLAQVQADVEAFLAAYPWDASMSQAKLRSELSKLSAAERADAILGAGLYGEALKRRGRSHPVDAARWVAAREFAPLAAAEKARPKQQFVRRGTRAWDAWWAYKRATTGVTVEPFYVFSKEYGCEGRPEPTLFPPKLPTEAATAAEPVDDDRIEF